MCFLGGFFIKNILDKKLKIEYKCALKITEVNKGNFL